MVLKQAASQFFIHFGVGTLLALLLVREPELKRSFFQFTATLCAVLLAFGLLLSDYTFGDSHRMYSPDYCLAGMLPVLLIYYALITMEKRRAAYSVLATAVLLGVVGVLGRLSMERAGFLIQLNAVAALLLCGIVLSTLLLGHWYLISPRLSFTPLLRGSLFFFVATCLRLAVMIALLIAMGWAGGMEGKLLLDRLLGWNDLGMFFLLRFFWGIAGPLVLSILVYRTAAIQSNQSATGILYVALVFVLIGELIADYFWAMAGIAV